MERNRGRKSSKPDSWHLSRILLKGLLAVGCVAGLVAGLGWLGRQSGRQVATQDRYLVRILDLDCLPPPGMEKATFLTEVRYLGELPESISSVDAATPQRLRTALLKHPWVKEVRDLDVTPAGQLRATVVYRTPVLAIQIPNGVEVRALDGTGVLLPVGAKSEGLAKLVNRTIGSGIPGVPWPDPDARRAAELAAAYPARQIEKRGTDWIIVQSDGRTLRVSTP